MSEKIKIDLRLFSIGGIGYGIIELIWRKYTHWSMVLTGGACFTCIYRLFAYMRGASFHKKCFFGSMLITIIEYIVGWAVNIKGKMKVWDYSSLPFNFRGQICLYYSILWGILMIPVSCLCEHLRKKWKIRY